MFRYILHIAKHPSQNQPEDFQELGKWSLVINTAIKYTKQIKYNLRRDMAIHFLVSSDMRIHDITEKIGYTAECPFYRLFTKWTGMAQGEYRRMFQAR